MINSLPILTAKQSPKRKKSRRLQLGMILGKDLRLTQEREIDPSKEMIELLREGEEEVEKTNVNISLKEREAEGTHHHPQEKEEEGEMMIKERLTKRDKEEIGRERTAREVVTDQEGTTRNRRGEAGPRTGRTATTPEIELAETAIKDTKMIRIRGRIDPISKEIEKRTIMKGRKMRNQNDVKTCI